MTEEQVPHARSATTRRSFVRKLALAGVTVAYATPLIETLSAAPVAAVSAPPCKLGKKFAALLSGAAQVPPNASPGTGSGTVVLSDDQSTITVDLSWSDLTAPATAAHIHGPALPGVNAPVLFPFSGVPAAMSGTIPEQSFAITPTQVAELQAGLLYMNIHTSNFPGGEIRGQLIDVCTS